VIDVTPEVADTAVSTTLMTHAGAVKVARNELSGIATPQATETWTPIPHAALVDQLEAALRSKGLHIDSEEYAVQTGGLKLFGTMKLSYQVTANRPGTQGFRFALGLRTSNDKSCSVKMVAGVNVFVCDNMALHGSMVTLQRKHTSKIDIMMELEGAVQKAMEQFRVLRGSVQRLQEMQIGDVAAKAMILDAATTGVMPLRLIPNVKKNYFEPPHEEFAPRTMWSLHNAFTESFKQLSPMVAQEAGMGLGEMFGF